MHLSQIDKIHLLPQYFVPQRMMQKYLSIVMAYFQISHMYAEIYQHDLLALMKMT